MLAFALCHCVFYFLLVALFGLHVTIFFRWLVLVVKDALRWCFLEDSSVESIDLLKHILPLRLTLLALFFVLSKVSFPATLFSKRLPDVIAT